MNKKLLPAHVRAAQGGFTLVEIMVVIVILGLLATMVAKNVMGAGDEARENKAKSDVVSIADAVRSYHVKHGQLPDNLEVLATKDDKGRSELENLPLDPWDTAYELRMGNTPRDWEVVSAGPNKTMGDDDDISNRTKKEN